MIPDQYVGAVVVIKAVKVREPAVRSSSEAAPTSVQVATAAPDQPALEDNARPRSQRSR